MSQVLALESRRLEEIDDNSGLTLIVVLDQMCTLNATSTVSKTVAFGAEGAGK